MSSNFVPCLTSVVLTASGTPDAIQYLDLVMEDWKFCRFVAQVAYSATAATTGVTIDLYGGTGVLTGSPSGGFPQLFYGSTIPSQPLAYFGDNNVSVSMVTVTPNSGTAVTKNTAFYFDFPQIRLPGLVRLKFANQDSTNSATIKLLADVS